MSRSTYRIQLGPKFGFAQVIDIAGYLADLGITHVYLSPITEAAAGSTHGYDVTNPTRIDAELGGPEGFARMASELRGHGLGILLDIVPNHVAVLTHENRWWWDVLKFGQASAFAAYFDIDWESPGEDLRGKVLVPILGDDDDELALDMWNDEPVLRYHEYRLPVDPATLTEPEPLVPELLARQHYLVAHWREGTQRLNYRRFFDITSLAGIRQEDPAVFAATHELVAPLAADRVVDGLRVDHIDGLKDPEAYLNRLAEATSEAWVVVEKITNTEEELPDTWPVAGTTGYEFLNVVNGLFVDRDGEDALTALYHEVTGEETDFAVVSYDAKHYVLEHALVPEITRLARQAPRAGIAEVLAHVPIYRSYGRYGREFVEAAIDAARRRKPELTAEIDAVEAALADPHSDFTQRFEQLSCGVAAMGVENTAFFRYNRLLALNEVGGNPGRFGTSIEEFHAAMARAQNRTPRGLVVTATHDSKWGEDLRVRLGLLSELPEEWGSAVRRWMAHNERHQVSGWPDANAEYVLYQVLVGAFPLTPSRAALFMAKATKEAKVHTSWTEPSPEYDTTLEHFVRAVVADDVFGVDLAEFMATLIQPGWVSWLAQTLLRLTAPGVPDTYQGAELWDLDLVDPDNRHPVDFETRRALIADAVAMTAEGARARVVEGAPKLMTLRRALEVRRGHGDTFEEGSAYTPLMATGAKQRHVVGFCRQGARSEVITLVPLHVLRLGSDWADTAVDLPAGTWHNAMTGEDIRGGHRPVSEIFARWPVALLVRAAG